MIEERSVFLEGKMFKAVISDELFLLREAMEAGKAVIGLEDGKDQPGGVHLYGVPYVILSMEEATPVFVERVVRRHAGLPWEICRTKRLFIRELTPEDASQIPAEEYAAREAVFRDRASLACYCQNQYPFYEYGTWALVGREDGCLVGLAGVNNPRLPEEMEAVLEERQRSEENQMPWLEIGYHIFRPYRQMGYCREALAAIAVYSHKELGARLCALIHKKNKASRRIAGSLGLEFLMEFQGKDRRSFGGQLLYGESWPSPPDKADPYRCQSLL